jgi:hypothetical protein
LSGWVAPNSSRRAIRDLVISETTGDGHLESSCENCVRMSGHGVSRVGRPSKHKDIFMYANICGSGQVGRSGAKLRRLAARAWIRREIIIVPHANTNISNLHWICVVALRYQK